MKAFAQFITRFHKIILLIGIIGALACAAAIPASKICQDQTAYLPPELPSRVALDIQTQEFGHTSDVLIMTHDQSEDTLNSLSEALRCMPEVASLYSQKSSVDDSYTLLSLAVKANAYSDEAKQVLNSIKSTLEQHGLHVHGKHQNAYISGTIAQANTDSVSYTLLFAVLAVIVILFIMGRSWLDPFLLLGTIGVAILYGMGTNALLPSVSKISFSIGALLQLVLSLDYSIMLLTFYREKREAGLSARDAMRDTLSTKLTAILASSTTTIAGLLCLVAMQFPIGRDLGIVLAKGVAFSLIIAFTVLPSAIIVLDKALVKTQKPSPTPTLKRLAHIQHTLRIPLAVVLLIIVVISVPLRSTMDPYFHVSIWSSDDATVQRYFEPESNSVILYPSTKTASDDDRALALVDKLKTLPGVKSVMSYETSIGKPQSREQLLESSHVPEPVTTVLMDKILNPDIQDTYTVSEFCMILANSVGKNNGESSLPGATGNVQGSQANGNNGNVVSAQAKGAHANSAGASSSTNASPGASTSTPSVSYAQDGTTIPGLSTPEAGTSAATPEQIAAMRMQQRMQLQQLAQRYQADPRKLTAQEMYHTLQAISPRMPKLTEIEALYQITSAEKRYNPTWRVSLFQLVEELEKQVNARNALFVSMSSSEKMVLRVKAHAMETAHNNFVGSHFNRMIITSNVHPESKEMTQFISESTELLHNAYGNETYVLGAAQTAHEARGVFNSDLQLVCILSIAAVFIIVALAFRSLSIPLLLVLLIQGSINVTAGITGVLGGGTYYVALVIVQAILMGATIDYAILFTENYRVARKTQTVRDALAYSYRLTIHTVACSGGILFITTGVLGLFSPDPTTSQVCLTLAEGAGIAIIFILLLLPATLACCDRVIRPKHSYRSK